MSLVGTRPPTLDEWEKYELHHRARLAIKPGITGMWQVSGRSDITDFEEVVKLDITYSANALLSRLKELQDLTGITAISDEDIIAASRKLMETCHTNYVLTTCGARGMVLVGDTTSHFIESAGKEVFDVTGAGDTTIAYLAACMANGFEMNDAVDIANYAAGIQVSKVGTSSVYWKEVREYLTNEENATVHKILIGIFIFTASGIVEIIKM